MVSIRVFIVNAITREDFHRPTKRIKNIHKFDLWEIAPFSWWILISFWFYLILEWS